MGHDDEMVILTNIDTETKSILNVKMIVKQQYKMTTVGGGNAYDKGTLCETETNEFEKQ